MAKFRRQALISATLVVACSSLAGSAEVEAQLQLVVTGKTVSLRILNKGVSAVAIMPAIAVQKKERSGWVPITTEFNATSSCEATIPRDKVLIAAHASLSLVPWKGYSCSGQCVLACRANIYYGPGVFRYVITRSPGAQTVTSPEFTLPATRQSLIK